MAPAPAKSSVAASAGGSSAPEKASPAAAGEKPQPPKLSEAASWRETIESVAMAVVLALLFKSFVAEAFVIPTGSMAPTLQGRHKDVVCPHCGYAYRANASEEVDRVDGSASGAHIVSATCPICRFTQQLDPAHQANHGSFSGDRIIVSKFAYDLGEPRRWDVFVFKFPGDATQNYIKRLVGLPGETIRITGGNIWTAPGEADAGAKFQIARKPPEKLAAMLQTVDDSNHIAPLLTERGWPARWRPWSAPSAPASNWKTEAGGRRYTLAPSTELAWLRYRNVAPTHDDWKTLLAGNLPPGVSDRPGALITDFYAYNAGYTADYAPASEQAVDLQKTLGSPPLTEDLGLHWVDDLAVECTAEITAPATGAELALELVRSGVRHRVTFDLASGQATFSRVGQDGGALPFSSGEGPSYATVTAATAVRGGGRHTLRLANCDHEMVLWVDGSPLKPDRPATYASVDVVAPVWTAADPLDLAPAGVAAKGAGLTLSSLRILRDKYYIATDGSMGPPSDYDPDGSVPGGYELRNPQELQQLFADPTRWAGSAAFVPQQRRLVDLFVGQDQFLPLGDNSPASYDGRYWTAFNHVVERDLLVGEAVMIYWPHSWNSPPYMPNFQRMQLIR